MRVPQYLLQCYMAGLPKLEAQEEIAAIQRGHAFTDRPMEDRDRARHMRELRKRAGYDHGQSGVSLESLAAFGITVVKAGDS